MAAAHATRAKLFLANKNYELYLNDAELALSCGYPENLRHTLYLTMGQAKLALKDTDAAIECFEKALIFFQLYSNVEKSVKTKFSAELSKKIADMKRVLLPMRFTIGTQTHKSDDDGGHGWITKCVCSGLTSCGNQRCSIKDLAECTFTDHYGRGLLSKKSFKKGDVVFVDRSWVTIPGLKHMDICCQYCFESLDQFCVPCDYCSQVLFCCKTCKSSGWNKFHKFECGLISALYEMGTHYRIAYRLFVMVSWSEMKAAFISHYEQTWDTLKKVRQCEAPVIESDLTALQYSGYRGVYNVMNNLESYDDCIFLCDHHSSGIFEECFRLLRFYEEKLGSTNEANSFKIDMFGSGTIVPVKVRAVRLNVLVRHVKQALSRSVVAASFDNLCPEGETINQDRDLRVFPVGAMINHSCEPNLIEHFIGREKVAYIACTDIRKGHELTNDYNDFAYLGDVLKTEFTCCCLPCSPERSEVSDEINDGDIGVQLKFCEFCSVLLVYDTTSGDASAVCKMCSVDVDPADVSKISHAYEIMRAAYNLRTEQNFKESNVRFRKCLGIRASVKNHERSSIVFLSWFFVASNLNAQDRQMDAVEYLDRMLNLIEAHSFLETQINIPTIHYNRLKWLWTEFVRDRLRTNNKRFHSSASHKVLDNMYKSYSYLVDKCELKTAKQRRFVYSIPTSHWLFDNQI